MYVNLCYFSDGWIINKFGDRVYRELEKKNIKVNKSDKHDCSADINHYFSEVYDVPIIPNRTTFMITHIDTIPKLNRVKCFTERGAVGICMSKQTMDDLIKCGISRDRVCYINPAQDGEIEPPKVRLGIMHKTHDDSRNREDILIDVCKNIDPKVFEIVIMGAGWEEIVYEIDKLGFKVEYYAEFDKKIYNKLILTLDYYCFWGWDEGSMGILDAIAAGVDTIVTPQGYHLDTGFEITYPVRTLNDILDALKKIEDKRKKHILFSKEWTWEKYAMKHLEIWKYMLHIERRNELLKNRGRYVDGIFSLLLDYPSYGCPPKEIVEGSRIFIWGAGKCGTYYFNYFTKKNVKIILWVDSAYEKWNNIGKNVHDVKNIFNYKKDDYDYIFIAISSSEDSKNIRNYLLDNNISDAKILIENDPF